MIGVGIVGLTTALLLARGGHRVALVTAEPVGGGSSGRSAGIVSQLHGTAYRRLAGETAGRNAAAYRAGNAAGFELIANLLETTGTAHERRDAWLVARRPEGARRIDDEHLAAQRAGLMLEKVQRADLPFAHSGALRLRDQIRVDARALLAGIAIAARGAGVQIFEQERVVDIRVQPHDLSRVETSTGVRAGRKVVLATGTPILDRGLYMLKTQAFRIMALEGTGVDPALPMITTIGPSGSVTVAAAPDGRAIVLGGAHPVGLGGPESRYSAAVERFAAASLPGFTSEAAWSGQDYRPFNPIAFVGALPRGGGSVYFASGFDGWGLTDGASAGIRLAADLLGRPRPVWATTIGHRITRPISQGIGLSADVRTAARRVSSVVRVTEADRRLLTDGHGIVHRTDAGLVATSRVDEVVQSVSGSCTRGGGAVAWNDIELSWDCPVCGSRFAADGSVLEGGARGGLAPVPDRTDWVGASHSGPAPDAVH